MNRLIEMGIVVAVLCIIASIYLAQEKLETELNKSGLTGWVYNNKVASSGEYKLFHEKGKLIIECPEFAKAQFMKNITSQSVVPGADYVLRYKVRAINIERSLKKADSGGNIYVWLWDYPIKGGPRRSFYLNECMMLEGSTTVEGEIEFSVPVDYKRKTITIWVRMYDAKGRLEVEKVSLVKTLSHSITKKTKSKLLRKY